MKYGLYISMAMVMVFAGILLTLTDMMIVQIIIMVFAWGLFDLLVSRRDRIVILEAEANQLNVRPRSMVAPRTKSS